MKALQHKFDVLLDGEAKSFTVLVDQRDFAAYEASDEYQEDGSRNATKLRFLCWNAMKRTNLIAANWQKFNGELCVQVALIELPNEEKAEGEETGDPS